MFPNFLFSQKTTKVDSTVVIKTDNNFLEENVDYNAEDSILFDIPNQKVYLYGKSFVKYGDIELDAGFMALDFKNKTIEAKYVLDSNGKMIDVPNFKDGDQKVSMEYCKYNFDTKKALIRNTKTNQDNGFLHAETVKSHSNKEQHLKHGKYTTCDLDHPHYYFGITKAVKKEESIIAGPLMLFVNDMPTPLALPFGFFPNKKNKGAGFIIPTYDNSERYGIGFLGGGYYFPIKDKIDFQILGSIYTRGNWGITAISRYKSIYKYGGDFNFSYQVTKDGHEALNNLSKANNFSIRWNHRQDNKARPNSSFSANVNISSLTNFQESFNATGEQFLSNTFASSIQYRKSFPNTPFSLNINASHSQNTQTKQVNITLPDVSWNMNRITPLEFIKNEKNRNNKLIKEISKIWLTWNSQFKNSLTAGDSSIALNNLPFLSKQMKNGIQHNLSSGTSFKIFNKKVSFNPGFRFTEKWYFQKLEKSFNNSTGEVKNDTLRGIKNWQRAHNYSTTASLTTKIYGMYGFAGFLKGKRDTKVRHVLTPTLSFNYNPSFDKRIFGYYGSDATISSYTNYDLGIFSPPPSSESGRIGLALANTLEMKMNTKSDTGYVSKKYSILDNFSINGSYDLFKDSIKFSNINMSARTTLFKIFSINGNAVLDPYFYDSIGGSVVKFNQSLYSQTNKLGRITSANMAIGFNLNQDKFKNKVEKLDKKQEETNPQLDAIKNNPNDYVDFEIPWNTSFSYNINYNKRYYLIYDPIKDIQTLKDSATIAQTINISGDINITKNWKIGVNTNYDITNKKISYTSVNIYRNLHCWEMAFNWIPFGDRRSYNFQINVKSSVLKDLKLSRRRAWFDNQIQ